VRAAAKVKQLNRSLWSSTHNFVQLRTAGLRIAAGVCMWPENFFGTRLRLEVRIVSL
jgi:hypothetical protein